jgi:ubiquinone/menaquinone biosynthesis C-methylase UbiE
MGWYEDRILPYIVDRSLGSAEAERHRAVATSGLAGTVVEVGFGSGRNVRHYPASVTRVLAVEPSERARQMARRHIEASTVPVELVGLDGQDLPLADGVADAVLSTWTLCTIPDLDRALAEMRRVLRPGGRLHFLEHGLADREKVRRWQHRLDPLQQRVFGGCHLNRPIDRLIADAGFELEAVAHPPMSGPKTFGYLYQGTAANPGTAA